MDYCARESTMNICREEVNEQTIQADIHETYRILRETKCTLDEFAAIVNGSKMEDKVPVDASSLWEEARMLTVLAYDNLQKLTEIKESIY